MAKKNSSSTKKPSDQLKHTLLTSTLLSILVIAACFLYLALWEKPAANQQAVLTQAQTLADSQATLLDQAITQLRQRLTASASNTELLKALQEQDEMLLAQYRAELIRHFPEALSVKLIPLSSLGIAGFDKEQYQLRNNIELDLLRYISNGEVVEPEAYKIGQRWMFSLAEPIKGVGSQLAQGALLVSFDQNYLQALIAQQDSAMGQTQLIQPYKNKQHLIATAGNAANSHYQASADATASPWQIQFIPSNELINHSRQSPLSLWIALAVALVIIIAAALMAASQLRKQLAHNLEQLLSSRNDFTLPGFAEAATQLKSTQKAQRNKGQPATTKKPAASKQPEAAPPKAKQPPSQETSAPALSIPTDLPATIFRAYDIRGLAEEELTDDVVEAIGMAIGSEAIDQGQQSIIVASDGRHSSPRIREAMIKGLLASGRDVIDIGMVPTPLMYFATHQLGAQSGVMITGSHNPANYNGIKMVIANQALSGSTIQRLRERILDKNLTAGAGQRQQQAIEQSYIDYIINDVAIAQPLKIVIDAGNGVAGAIAPRLFEELGCEIIPLYCDVDGDFPNHHPDPTVESNLSDLKTIVAEQGADLGIAFDGDGDRLGVVTATGKSVPADRLLMLLAQDVVSRNPGADVLFDVKCTRNLNTLISNYGGRPIMWKTGHSFMKEKMVETGALLGGEFSGHIFFKERWFGFDDGMYAAARLIEILSTTDPDLDLQLDAFPDSVGSPELKVETSEEAKFSIIEQLVSQADFGDGKVSTLDGLRADFPDGWGLVRASNTTPMLILRFEADSEEALGRIQQLFKEQLLAIDPGLSFSF